MSRCNMQHLSESLAFRDTENKMLRISDTTPSTRCRGKRV